MKIIIAAGGTGGHIIPAICTADYFAHKDYDVTIFGDKNCKNYVKKTNLKFYLIPSSQVKNKITATIKISIGIIYSLILILTKRPKYVICFGGYACFPVGIAAIISRTKLITHEQNAHIGKVNKILSKYCEKVALTFKNTDGLDQKINNKYCHIGVPVKKEISALHNKPFILPDFAPKLFNMDTRMGYDVILKSDFKKTDIKRQFFTITIIGGSGGAKIFSDIIPNAIFNLKNELKPKILIFQQCRKDLLHETFEKYKSFGVNIITDHFFEDMPSIIAQSHLVIARCGASTLFELSAAKKPAIIVPFAKSSDDHQLKNAKYFASNNAAIMIKEDDFTINNVSKILNDLILNKEKLEKLSKNISKLALPFAEQKLFNIIDESRQ